MVKIYHNPRCKKSRAGLHYLQTKTSDIEIVEYLKNGLSEEELEALLKKIDLPVELLIRKQEAIFKEKYKGKTLTQKDWIRAIVQYPKLLQRPIIETNNKAVLADPAENMDILF